MSFLITELKKSVSEYLNTPTSSPLSKEENEIKEEPTVDSLLQKNYTYLDKEDLTMQFGFDRDLTKSYTLHICLFQINNSIEKPFVEFYLENRDGSFQFIQKTIDPSIFQDSEDIEETFIKQCEEVIQLSFTNLTTDYKGYVEFEEHIYAIYENLGDKLEVKKGSCLALVDEIVNVKKIEDTPIHEYITKMFENNSEFLNMKDDDSNIVENPILAYLCKKNDDVYENVISDSSIDEIDTSVNHNIFGNIYLLTKNPIDNTGGFFSFFSGSAKLKRYSLFLENSIDVSNNETNITEFMKEKDITEYDSYTCILYQENGNTFYVVKSKTLFTEI